MFTVSVYDNYNLIALQYLDTDDIGGCESLRFFFLNAMFESSLIPAFSLNSCCLIWKLNSTKQLKNDFKATKLQGQLSIQILFEMMKMMYNIQTKFGVDALRNRFCSSDCL